MTPFARKLVLSTVLGCLSLVLGVTPAIASTHHKHHAVRHAARHHVAKGSTVIRIAQKHLYNLGYYVGSIDGVMGGQTKAAIKRFQRDHGLKPDGALGGKTNRALEDVDHNGARVLGAHSFSTNERVTSGNARDALSNPNYATSLNGGTRIIASRFARVDVSESGGGASKRYNIDLNGQPILIADGQPSVVGISPTYDLGNEDAVIITTYSPNESGCTYRNHVLALNGGGTKLLDLDSCTRDFDAVAKNGSLFITFVQHDSNSATGSTWRLEGTNLVRL